MARTHIHFTTKRGPIMLRERRIALAVAIVALAWALNALFTAHPGLRLTSALCYSASACLMFGRALRATTLARWGLALACFIVALIAVQVRIY
jgi:hypothetical protein